MKRSLFILHRILLMAALTLPFTLASSCYIRVSDKFAEKFRAEIDLDNDDAVDSCFHAAPFREICLKGSADCRYEPGEGPCTVTVRGHRPDLDEVVVETDSNGVLQIFRKPEAHSMGFIRIRHDLDITIRGGQTGRVTLDGSGDFSCKGIQTDTLSLLLSGSGDIDFEGVQAQHVSVLLSGSGDIELSGSCDSADFCLSGSGDIDAKELDIKQKPSKTVSGSGDIELSAR